MDENFISYCPSQYYKFPVFFFFLNVRRISLITWMRYVDYASDSRILQTLFCFVAPLFCSDVYGHILFLHGQPVPVLRHFSMNTGTSEVKQVHISSTYHRRLNYFSPCFSFIIIFINCNWVVTRWQWLFYMYTKHEIGYY